MDKKNLNEGHEDSKDSNKFQESVTKQINSLFDIVVKSRREYYEEASHRRPQKSDVAHLIKLCAQKNAAISGSAGIVPGPFGMLALIPEIVAVTRNQLNLIYDIAVACGKEKYMTRDLLLQVFASAFGAAAGSLGLVHGSKLIVKRSSLRVMQKLVTILGGKITQQAIKASLGRWVPLAGAGALAIWSYKTTESVGNKAFAILSLDVIEEEE